MTHHTMSEPSTMELHLAPSKKIKGGCSEHGTKSSVTRVHARKEGNTLCNDGLTYFTPCQYIGYIEVHTYKYLKFRTKFHMPHIFHLYSFANSIG